MSVHNLDNIFRPKSIAVIGASEKKGRVGSAIMQNLIQGGFPGEIYPINEKYPHIFNKKAFGSLKHVDTPVDLVVIATPISSAIEIIQECGETGAKGAVIISAGGKETGEQGRRLETMIQKEATKSGLRIIGPNCLGIVCTTSHLNASFANRSPLPGKMAFISQSGAICTSILDLSIKERIGFSYFISLGSMLDVNFGDMIDYIGGDSKVNSIVMYIESLNHFRNFMNAARSVSRIKPVVVLKTGRTKAGARAAASHTGAMAGEDEVYDAAFKRAGILRVKTFEELFDCAELLAKKSSPDKPGLAIITNAGGPGVMAADTLSDYGIEPVTLSVETIAQLNDILPDHWSHANPIDILGDASAERYCKVVDTIMHAPEVNSILMMTAPVAVTDTTEIAGRLSRLLRQKDFPVFASWIGGIDVEEGRTILNNSGIPTFDTPERAVRAFMDIYHHSKNLEMLTEIPPKLPVKLSFDKNKAHQIIHTCLQSENFQLTEIEAKNLLGSYGVPVNRSETAGNETEALQKAEKIGYPVAMKIISRNITHKTDAGGTKLNVMNGKEVRLAFRQLLENASSYHPEAVIEGVTIQSMHEGSGYELIIGAKKDTNFGPVILFGMGGIMTEVLQDKAIALPPLNRMLAKRLMEQTKVYQLLKGYRNRPPVNLIQLEEILIRISQLVTDFSEIEAIDINPLIVSVDTACAVDARVVLSSADVPAPLHLVISPYPNQYESNIVNEEIGELLIRPIKPEDAPLLLELFDSLAPQSVYFRFFTPMKKLPHTMLARFTQIDYDREIAMVAIQVKNGKDKMLGVARACLEWNQKDAEFAAVVGDQWHGKGVGAELLKQVLAIAKERKIKRIVGTVLAENKKMLNLGKKMGMTISLEPGTSEYKLSLDLEK